MAQAGGAWGPPSLGPPGPAKAEEAGPEGADSLYGDGIRSRHSQVFVLDCVAFFENAFSRKWNIKAKKCHKAP